MKLSDTSYRKCMGCVQIYCSFASSSERDLSFKKRAKRRDVVWDELWTPIPLMRVLRDGRRQVTSWTAVPDAMVRRRAHMEEKGRTHDVINTRCHPRQARRLFKYISPM